ncbi:hypothetical protein G6F68_018325 [Rhizopus microsporus]|nr:hypothetical protein G6F68_018325 [Rhizopus microsporus]
MLPQRGGEIIHGTGQHVSKKIRTQAESVGDGHEDGWRDFIVSRRAPAAERFKSHELPRANSTQWLVGQFDLAALQCKHQPLLMVCRAVIWCLISKNASKSPTEAPADRMVVSNAEGRSDTTCLGLVTNAQTSATRLQC